jgi:hypothetical protein
MSKKIIRPKEGWARLGCGHTKFGTDYVLKTPAEPYVAGTRIKRLKPIRLGPRNIGFLESDVDALITALASQRDAA